MRRGVPPDGDEEVLNEVVKTAGYLRCGRSAAFGEDVDEAQRATKHGC